MLMSRIKRWHWIVISLVAGAALGVLNRMSRQDWDAAYGESLSQAQFVAAVGPPSAAIGHLTGIVVYPEVIELSPGVRKPVDIVVGQYKEDASSGAAGSHAADVSDRRCFIAEIPFVLSTPNAATPAGTVMAYLDHARISYRYAWWRDPKTAMTLWTGGSFVLIGLIWPTLLNLLAYGSIFQPAGEKGTDLSKVFSGSGRSKAGAGLTDQDLLALQTLESELESDLAQSAPAVVAPPASAPPKKPAELAATPVQAAAADHPTDDGDFELKPTDYYPIARPKRDHHSDPPT